MPLRLVKTLLIAMMISVTSTATAKDVFTDPYKNYDETIFMDMELNDNILTPNVGKNEHSSVKHYMSRMAQELARRYTVDLMRNDEVILVTIPTDELFLPNDTLLSTSASTRLTPLMNMLKDPEMYKVVYAIHTDNTGSTQYNMFLSHERNNSLYDWMLNHISEDLIVIPYEFGDTEPISSNNTMDGRAENRRIEFYLIPGPKMITLAHKGMLK